MSLKVLGAQTFEKDSHKQIVNLFSFQKQKIDHLKTLNTLTVKRAQVDRSKS